jgi:hypothetical protein
VISGSNPTALVHTIDGGHQLRIDSAKAEHAGFFVCRATNELGMAEVEFNVDIIQRPILIDTATEKINIKRGDSVALDCPLRNYSFSGNITW